MLHKNTFGDTPAAIYLVHILNEENNSKLTSKISKYLVNYFCFLNELVESRENDTLSRELITFIANRIRIDALNTFYEMEVKGHNKIVCDLAANLVCARVKEILNSSMREARGCSTKHTNENKSEILIEKSKNKLREKSKPDRLY